MATLARWLHAIAACALSDRNVITTKRGISYYVLSTNITQTTYNVIEYHCVTYNSRKIQYQRSLVMSTAPNSNNSSNVIKLTRIKVSTARISASRLVTLFLRSLVHSQRPLQVLQIVYSRLPLHSLQVSTRGFYDYAASQSPLI